MFLWNVIIQCLMPPDDNKVMLNIEALHAETAVKRAVANYEDTHGRGYHYIIEIERTKYRPRSE